MLTTVFGFQSTVCADESRSLILDFTKVPYVDSAGIGALVGVSQQVRDALKVTRGEQFFQFFDSVSAARPTTAA